MRGTTHSMFLLSTVLLTACKGDGAGDSGNGIVYPQGCIPVSYTHLTLPTNREV